MCRPVKASPQGHQYDAFNNDNLSLVENLTIMPDILDDKIPAVMVQEHRHSSYVQRWFRNAPNARFVWIEDSIIEEMGFVTATLKFSSAGSANQTFGFAIGQVSGKAPTL